MTNFQKKLATIIENRLGFPVGIKFFTHQSCGGFYCFPVHSCGLGIPPEFLGANKIDALKTAKGNTI